MSIIVPGIALPVEADPQEAIRLAAVRLGWKQGDVKQGSIYRRSVDARRGKVQLVYSVELIGEGVDEDALAERFRNASVRVRREVTVSELLADYTIRPDADRPVVVGFGPGGMFAALILARAGLRPIVLERGDALEQRDGCVERFSVSRSLDPESNIQFGEGGAGAYSDGKLTTRINDPLCEVVLAELIAHGAPGEIARSAHPHIGTDLLKNVVRAIRREVIDLGGEVRFRTALTDLRLQSGRLTAAVTSDGEIGASHLILATGHSARDTFASLLHRGVTLIPKNFAVGVRIEHLQDSIDEAMLGRYAGDPRLGAAEYSVSNRVEDRGCFSFCMCPGGYLTASSSEPETVVTNGMSRHARNGRNGNSALAVSVDASAFGDPLGGVTFARSLESRAFVLGGGDYTAPAQLVGDFLADRPSTRGGRVEPTYPLGVRYGKVDEFLPNGGAKLLRDSLMIFARRHRFFADPDAVLTAPETRTSSPVRLPRGADGRAEGIDGLYPCGEGAGYAGGIMSAAVDGIKSALAVLADLSEN